MPKDPRFASATITDASSTWSGAYGVGEMIPGAGEIVQVTARHVDFENRATGRIERLDLLGVPPSAPPAPPPTGGGPRAVPAPSAGGDLAAELDQAIKRSDDTHYTISRGMVEKLLADPSLIAGAARIRPVASGPGLMLSYVRPGSAPDKLGLKKGDVLLGVNGYELSQNYDKLLELYTKLKSASNVSVEVRRGDKTLTLSYGVR
jgi:type II secretory pathway component PulC